MRGPLLALTVGVLALAGAAEAQILPLPGGAGGGLPSALPNGGVRGFPSELPGRVGDLGDRLERRLERLDPVTRSLLDELTLAPERLTELARRSGGALELDPLGWPVVSGELVATDLSDAARAQALAEGFTLLREERLQGLDMRLTVLAPPRRLSLARGLARLKQLDPGGAYVFNHVHAPAGETSGAVEPPPAPLRPQAGGTRRVGLIDTGVTTAHPALAGVRVTQQGFAGQPTPAAHGTAVASLLVGEAGGFRGAAPGANLYVADVYGGSRAGGSSEALARALAWMAQNQVTVVNVSLVGPRNAVVEAAIRRVSARGITVVAAVGNDGPAAPPLYPSAYPGVVGVTAVNAQDRVLPEAARGPHVSFAAPGADIAAAGPGGGYVRVRGASFAAPLVAGLIAREGLSALSRQARDLGAPGRDPVYGAGLVGGGLRVSPQTVGARGQLSR